MSHLVNVSYPIEKVAVISFSDPARENQLCWAAVDELAAQLEASRAAGARVLVLTSDYAGLWLEHAWLQDLLSGLEGAPQTGSGSGWFKAQQTLTHQDVVSIAAINGDTAGGGAELGWACDIRIAERQARFSQPEVNMGLTTGIGGCSRLARLAGAAMAREMVLTGQAVGAERLYTLGAVTTLVESGQALDRALQMAERIAQHSPAALAGLKQVLDEGEEMILSDALALEQQVFQSVVAGEAALSGMRRIQSAYDAGQTIAQANNYAT